jgi:hypothetical protein
LALIGEDFEDMEGICGAVIQLRRNGDRIVLWTGTTDKGACERIGTHFKKLLEIEENIDFISHADAKARYFLAQPHCLVAILPLCILSKNKLAIWTIM